jgi:hypothetical protein
LTDDVFVYGASLALDMEKVFMMGRVQLWKGLSNKFNLTHKALSFKMPSMWWFFFMNIYDALPSHGVRPSWRSHKVKLRNQDLVARSQLPTLERGRGSSWEPRD